MMARDTYFHKTFMTLCLVSIIAALLLIQAAFPLSSLAQEPETTTPTPDFGDIYEVQLLNGLPAVLRFRVRINLPHNQVDQVLLTLRQDDGIQATFEIDQDASVFIDFGDQIEYEYNVELAGNRTIRLFEPLHYLFEVESSAGKVSSAAQEVTLQHDTLGEWQSASQDFLTLDWYSENIAGRSQLDYLSDTLDLIQDHTGFSTPLRLVLYDANTPICEQGIDAETGQEKSFIVSDGREFACNPDTLRQLYANSGMIMLKLSEFQFAAINATLTKKLVEVAYQPIWGNSDIPAWFADGLAALYLRNNPSTSLGMVQRAAQEDRLLRLSQLLTPPDTTWTSSQTELWRSQAYLLTLYLAEAYGAETPFELASAIKPNVSFEAKLTDLSGDTMDKIYRAWALWVNSTNAARAVQWNPYLATTPTPTATVTFSPIPPSRTPRPTATITPTYTQLPLFVPPTPLPPTRNAPTQAPTASNTPLPPGYFNTQTPPSPPAQENNDTSGLCGTGIGALVLPAIGLIVARRKRVIQ